MEMTDKAEHLVTIEQNEETAPKSNLIVGMQSASEYVNLYNAMPNTAERTEYGKSSNTGNIENLLFSAQTAYILRWNKALFS